jgi:hypothetical protein
MFIKSKSKYEFLINLIELDFKAKTKLSNCQRFVCVERKRGDGCKFSTRFLNISGIYEDDDAVTYWRTENWKVLESKGAYRHTCGIAIKI